jgi:hypothetical protein
MFTVLAALTMMLTIAVSAQITTTGIRGIVRDPNGAVVPNATIQFTDNSTGGDRKFTQTARVLP